LTDTDRSPSRRTRLTAGLGVIAASLLIATTVAGVGFAGGSISAAQYQYGKVTICHYTHSKKHPAVTITISQHAWPAHRRHGDTLGACTVAAPTVGHGKGHGKDSGSKGSGGATDSGSTTTTTTATAPTHGHSSGHGHK
jgi:hypothetical protein